MIKELKQLEIPISMQITLDGNRDKHNKIRFTKNGENSFDTIVNNIKSLISHKINVNCRLNYTQDNIYSIADIIDEFTTISKDDLKYLNFNMQRIWQDYDSVDLKDEERTISSWFHKECLPLNTSSILSQRHCYADYENSFIINYDGKIFKCTARDFASSTCDGELTSDGKILTNKQYNMRMELKRGGVQCKKCNIYPICHVSCSQFALENKPKIENNLCLFNYTEEQKQQKIVEQITLRIQDAISSLSNATKAIK